MNTANNIASAFKVTRFGACPMKLFRKIEENQLYLGKFGVPFDRAS
jgi:hypothetical protein